MNDQQMALELKRRLECHPTGKAAKSFHVRLRSGFGRGRNASRVTFLQMAIKLSVVDKTAMAEGTINGNVVSAIRIHSLLFIVRIGSGETIDFRFNDSILDLPLPLEEIIA